MQLWTSLLQAENAQLDTQGHARFPASAEAGSTCLIPLSYQGLLHVSGPDTVKFLQGQLTCDLRLLDEGWALSGAQCNLKGRVISYFSLAPLSPQDLLISLPREVLPRLQTGLQTYSVFSKVTLNDVSDKWLAFALQGPQAEEMLARHTGLRLKVNQTTVSDEGLVLIRVQEQSYQCWGDQTSATKLWQALAEECPLADSHTWQLAEIRRGHPEVDAFSSERYTPQALNLDLIGAVSFKKGCYTGQEVVARLHYKGTTKKRLYRLGLPTEVDVQPGSALVNAEGTVQGEILMAAPAGAGQSEALAILPVGFNQPLHLQQSTQVVERLPLPYTLPEEHS